LKVISLKHCYGMREYSGGDHIAMRRPKTHEVVLCKRKDKEGGKLGITLRATAIKGHRLSNCIT
jgi:hypothetical protein